MYFEAEIPNNTDDTYWSHRSDDQLGSEAPGLSDSIPLSHQARFVASHQGSVFCDGGASSPNLLRWSRAGQPESFDALDYAILPDAGGGITGLIAATDLLLVLRERSIYAVQGGPGTYRVIPLLDGVGAFTPHASAVVPGLGVVLLTTDGVWAIGGSIVGGGTPTAQKLSEPISRTLGRLTRSAAKRATAAYSPLWREWHCYFPIDGSDRNQIGIVLHLDHPQLAWSIREGFPVGCLATTYDGELVFGHRDGSPGEEGSQSGLFVITRARIAGGTFVEGDEQDPDTVIDNPPVESKYRAAWNTAPSAAQTKKHVRHVYVEALTQAGTSVTIGMAKDWETAVSSSSQSVVWQRADAPASQPVFDSAVLDAVGVLWQEPYVASIRFDVAAQAASYITWELTTSVDTVLLGHSLEGTVPGKQVIGATT
jgi:hypothetical protein